MKTILTALIVAIGFFSARAKPAGSTPSDTAHKSYTIENCVNSFDPAKVESTKVGYQYWFVDRNFLDGR